MITCKICGKEVKQITSSHLKSHQMTISLYKEQFPGSPIIDPETSAIISSKASGRERTQEHKDALRATISAQYANGRKANRGKLGKSDSEETLEKKRLARTGKTHTQQTKDKIGLAHRGKTVSRESVEKCRETKKARIEEFGPYTPGVMSPEVMEARNAKLSEIARKRTPDQVAEKVRLMNEARRGQKLTPEARLRYSEARLKFMKEHPEKLGRKMFDTVPELEFERELQNLCIEYQKQFHTSKPHFVYDFKILENILIEIDGPYHRRSDLFDSIDEFNYRVERDKIKRISARAHGYHLFNIPVEQHLPEDWKEVLLEQGMDITNPTCVPLDKDPETLYGIKKMLLDIFRERSKK